MCCIKILLISNFDPLSKRCKRNANSGSLSNENKWPVNWASVAYCVWKNIKRSFKYFERCIYFQLVNSHNYALSYPTIEIQTCIKSHLNLIVNHGCFGQT